ncbi:hypothetical protein JQ633_07940 [Bradyrhizobium tropiciagri]|uniref:hypothetical protein n=1 Tax=Bradyrhizobium tropiciagri TaxID=312253 RepID=UPI001BAAAC92|nr:hypothetical protein [Bradyrhizobium tropiciagri]MBR0870283.1 hypothetical protein [Bradyrhizobium tropiciagri]
MSFFLLSLLAGLCLHRLVSLFQPTRIELDSRARIVKLGRRIVIEIESGAYLALKVTIATLALVGFIIFAVVLNAQFVHPANGFPYRFVDALSGPRMASIVFGGLVGILLGNLLNRVLTNEADYKFTATDRLEFVLIFVLFLLGIGGEEIVRSSAQRINKISVGTTTEISFADTAPKSSRLSAEQPGGALQTTQGGKGTGGGSAGLGKLYDIGSVGDQPNIERDWEFIVVLARHEQEQAPAHAPDISRVSFDVLSPVASCLSRISRLYGDDAFVEEQLIKVTHALRELMAGEPRDHVRQLLAGTVRSVVQYDNARSDDFKTMAAQLKPELDQRTSCDRLTARGYDAAPALTDESLERFRNSNAKYPYFAMSYASVMAARRRYEAAAITMDAWIREHYYPPKTAEEKWYRLRAQITQAIFLDEWIRERGAAASSPLRKYHIDNLRDIVDGMRNFSVISEISRKNSQYDWSFGIFGASESGDDGTCEVPALPKPVANSSGTVGASQTITPDDLKPDEATNRLKSIYNTYLSSEKDHVDHSLKHPIEKVRSGALIEDEIAKLMRVSLKCISYTAPGQRRMRAEHIERYVRSELNMLETTSGLKSRDEIAKKIRESRQLLTLAFQIIDKQVKEAKSDIESGPIQNHIAAPQVLEVYETLLATQAQLQSYSERDVAN